MRLAVGFNPVIPVREMTRLALKGEASGYESVWIHESLYQRDVVTYLASILGSTKRIKAASGAINTFTRHPVTTATTFANLSELSEGRAILGLGLGSFPTIPLIGYKIFPATETKPLVRMKEYVGILQAIWSGQKVSFKGSVFTVNDLELGFKMTHQVPLYLASLFPMTLRFAGRSADGAILSPTLATVEATARMANFVKEGETAGKRRVERASYMMTSMDPDLKTARETVKKFYFFLYQLSEVLPPNTLEKYGVTEERLKPMKEAWKRGDVGEASRLVPDEAVDALTIVGTPDKALQRVSEYVKVGVDLPIIMPIGNTGYAMDSLAPGERLAA
ncbi:MAG TPA: LLM class flavin-dependent oxidoreductase [Nitrososphaerales archaeon]|nr:LLM class flavin-dependent oxidoreductase [Nitrososphaerales archaeon]